MTMLNTVHNSQSRALPFSLRTTAIQIASFCAEKIIGEDKVRIFKCLRNTVYIFLLMLKNYPWKNIVDEEKRYM